MNQRHKTIWANLKQAKENILGGRIIRDSRGNCISINMIDSEIRSVIREVRRYHIIMKDQSANISKQIKDFVSAL